MNWSDIHPKVAGATVGATAVQLICALLAWKFNIVIPPAVESPAAVIGTFIGGYLTKGQ